MATEKKLGTMSYIHENRDIYFNELEGIFLIREQLKLLATQKLYKSSIYAACWHLPSVQLQTTIGWKAEVDIYNASA
jgi:hypothetical protein